ncbi:hypothetical protein [Roseobacter sp.]|uniref:hypothetical protein n=1 Tax=Roseobacter sp. TaxID=1907202 RepID=UPI0029676B2E|nr:hypothetical protein [Roseobacter sp.]MDW3181759.1 hypothetical protein [Roseobacter sp.]
MDRSDLQAAGASRGVAVTNNPDPSASQTGTADDWIDNQGPATLRSDAPTGIDQLREQLRNPPEMPFEATEGPPPPQGPPDGPDGPDGPESAPEGPEDYGKGEIWPGCPVKPLGVYGDVCFYLDVLGQLRSVDNHSLDKIRSLFGGRVELLSNHFPQYDKSGGKRARKFDQAEAAAAMTDACYDQGVWSPTGRARGAGCWTDEDGKLIYHAGDAVLIDGEWQPPGVYDKRVYSAADPIPRPATSEPRDNPAHKVLDTLETWNWRRPDIDPNLTLGVICAMILGGALDWRPPAWATGDAATGKSELQKFLRYILGGEAGLLQAADATEAGIRSVVGYSSLPVAIDEFEPDPDNPTKTKRVIELARRASSGGQIFRGSTDQKGYQGNAYSCFLFSSILLPAMPAQDRSRLIVLNLDRLPDGIEKLNLDPRVWRGVGAALRKRLMDEWDSWPTRLATWRAALAEHGQAGRAADNYGTVLALADMALGQDTADSSVTNAWAKKLGAALKEDTMEVGSNADDMMHHLLTQHHDAWRKGQRWMMSQFVMAAAALPGAPEGIYPGTPHTKEEKQSQINAILVTFGLRVKGFGHEAQLFLPNKSFKGLCDLFEGTVWANGVWSQAASRLDGAERTKSPLTLAGASSRGHWIPFRSMSDALMAFPADGRSTAPASRPLPPDTEGMI